MHSSDEAFRLLHVTRATVVYEPHHRCGKGKISIRKSFLHILPNDKHGKEQFPLVRIITQKCAAISSGKRSSRWQLPANTSSASFRPCQSYEVHQTRLPRLQADKFFARSCSAMQLDCSRPNTRRVVERSKHPNRGCMLETHKIQAPLWQKPLFIPVKRNTKKTKYCTGGGHPHIWHWCLHCLVAPRTRQERTSLRDIEWFFNYSLHNDGEHVRCFSFIMK